MNTLVASLMAMSGDENVVVVRKPLVQFTGCLEAGMMLNQLLYWTPKSKMGGWIAKSDKEFGDELCLTQYSTRKARNVMEKMGILETKTKKFNGSPTTHYRLKLDALEQSWSDFVNSKPVLLNSKEPSIEIEETITETTTEKDNEDSNESSPAPKKRRRKKSELDVLKSELTTHFSEVSGLPKPRSRSKKECSAAAKLWWNPLVDIAECVEKDPDRARALIDWALAHADRQKPKLTVKAPISIAGIATAEQARRLRENGHTKPIESDCLPEQAPDSEPEFLLEYSDAACEGG